MIEKLIAENELLPLNFDNIPNAKYIDESFRNLGYDRKTSILCHISGELSEFFTTKKWCRRKLTPGYSVGQQVQGSNYNDGFGKRHFCCCPQKVGIFPEQH